MPRFTILLLLTHTIVDVIVIIIVVVSFDDDDRVVDLLIDLHELLTVWPEHAQGFDNLGVAALLGDNELSSVEGSRALDSLSLVLVHVGGEESHDVAVAVVAHPIDTARPYVLVDEQLEVGDRVDGEFRLARPAFYHLLRAIARALGYLLRALLEAIATQAISLAVLRVRVALRARYKRLAELLPRFSMPDVILALGGLQSRHFPWSAALTPHILAVCV